MAKELISVNKNGHIALMKDYEDNLGNQPRLKLIDKC